MHQAQLSNFLFQQASINQNESYADMNNKAPLLNHVSEDLNLRRTTEDNLENQTLYEGFKVDPMNYILFFLIFFFEYWVISSFLDRITQLRRSESSDFWFEKNMFTISQFIYQAGLLIARFSLYCCQTKKTEIITFLLFAISLFFFILCLWYYNISIWIVFVFTLFVGLLGGWGYLFTYYRLMDNKQINPKNKEILVNWLTLSGYFGSMFATFLALILSNTILKIT